MTERPRIVGQPAFNSSLLNPASPRGSKRRGTRRNAASSRGKRFGGSPGLRHGCLEAGREHLAVFRRAVVVLPRGDIAAATRDVDLRHVRQGLLPSPASHAHEVGRDASLAVVAHRMNRVVAQGQEGLFAVPEAQRLEPGVDGPLGGLVGPGVARCAGAVVQDGAVRQDIAAVGGDLVDPRLADADVADAKRRLQEAGTQRPGHALDDQLVEGQVADGSGPVILLEQPLGPQVGDRRVMLVDGRDQDVLGVGPGRAGQHLASGHRRRCGARTSPPRAGPRAGQRAALQHEPDRLEPIHDGRAGSIPPPMQGCPGGGVTSAENTVRNQGRSG